MSFLSSLFLWALPLAAVPIVIHLLNRRRRQVVRWGAMQLLLESVPTRRRIWNINDFLLMLLRALAVAAVVLAFARPQLRSGVLTGRTPGRDVIFVVDTSLSTGRLQAGTPVFNQIRQTAHDAIERLEPSDHVRLLAAASVPRWLEGDAEGKAATKKQAADRLSDLKPTLAAADMPACVQAALLSEPPADAPSRLVVVVTDGAAHGWKAESASPWQAIHDLASRAALPTAVNVVIAGKSKGPVGNLAIEKLSMIRTRLAVGEPFAVTARVRNTGDLPREATVLKWDLDGQPNGESQVVALEPGESSDVVFETACDQAGVFAVTGKLARDDDLPGDNAASIVVEAMSRLPILVCRGDAELERPPSQPDFLKAALGRGPEGSRGDYSPSVFDPTFIGLDALAGADLSQYRLVVLENVVPKSSEVVDRLFDFTARGGGLWLILGDNVTADDFNAHVFRGGSGLIPVSLGQRVKAGGEHGSFFTIHPPEGPHPATVLLGDTERLDIDDVRISEFWQLSTPETSDDVAVLLESGDGAPLAVEHLAGEGRIIVQALPAAATWSNLPICQVFVPLVHEWIWYLTAPTMVEHNLDPGGPIVLSSPLAPSASGRKGQKIEIKTPFDETISLSGDNINKGGEGKFRETVFPGTYVETISQPDVPGQKIPFSVRRDPDESRLAPLSAEQIAVLEQKGGVRFLADGLASPAAGTSLPRYQPLWTSLLIALGFLFLFELAATYLLTKRRFAR